MSCNYAAMQDVPEDQLEANALEIYTAVKPTGREPELQKALPELKAVLHPHQRRAAAWMVGRETLDEVTIVLVLTLSESQKLANVWQRVIS